MNNDLKLYLFIDYTIICGILNNNLKLYLKIKMIEKYKEYWGVT